MFKVVLAIASVCVLAGCSSGANTSSNADIAKVVGVKSSFGPDFKVLDRQGAIDTKLLASSKLPDGLTFDPANCAKVAAAPDMPADMQGNMAAVEAEGNGIRYIVIAMETSKAVPINDPGKDCGKVAFAGGQVRGLTEVIDAPRIDGTHTQGRHRFVQAVVGRGAYNGQLYDYFAQFGDYRVIVTANPVPVPGQPAAKVDTQRASDLLVKAVNAIRS
jgi:hypothetical protein